MLPDVLAYRPRTHLLHCVLPSANAYCPTAHSSHCVLRAVLLLYRPTPQSTHFSCPDLCHDAEALTHLPAGHTVHTFAPGLARVSVKLPAGHGAQGVPLDKNENLLSWSYLPG